MKHFKQLDGLRAVAVIMVIVSHWLPETSLPNRVMHNNLGSFGVIIFFVLSGFLITWILLMNKRDAEIARLKKGLVLKNFFFRRALRIFPIYYLFITVVLIFHKFSGTHITENYPYFYTYTANFYFDKIGKFDGMLSPVWSLCVEEQFYLVWPWLILFSTRKLVLPVIISFIAVGLCTGLIYPNALTGYFDSFGIGALLSWQLVYHPDSLRRFYVVGRFAGLLSGLLLIVFITTNLAVFPFNTACSGLSLWAISYIVQTSGQESRMNILLGDKLLTSIGKVSYGLYLYHIPVYYCVNFSLHYSAERNLIAIRSDYYNNEVVLLTLSTIILTVVSVLSYKYIELRFLKLKKYFEIPRARSTSPGREDVEQPIPLVLGRKN